MGTLWNHTCTTHARVEITSSLPLGDIEIYNDHYLCQYSFRIKPWLANRRVDQVPENPLLARHCGGIAHTSTCEDFLIIETATRPGQNCS